MRRFVSILLVVGAMSSVLSASPASAAEIVLRPPTSAVIASRFSLPQGQFGPGNRGIDYGSALGDPITASGPGIVVFSGPVAGSLHVTIDHGGGLLTSYSFVDRLLVVKGDRVEAGEKIAISGDGFHFGMRVDGRYVDPEAMFGIRKVEVSLVPSPKPGERDAWLDLVERSERVEFLDLHNRRSGGGVLGFIRTLIDGVGSATFTPLRWLKPFDRITEMTDTVWMLAVLAIETDPKIVIIRGTMVVWDAFRPGECTEAGVDVVAPEQRRIAIVVDGLDSSSNSEGAMAQLDLESHGYAVDDIIGFSYRGGRVPARNGSSAGSSASAIPTSTYDASDTRGSVADNVADMEDLLARVSAAYPGVTIDVYGHSLGGLIAKNAVAGMADKVEVGVVITLGAPIQGVPLAEIVQSAKLFTPISVAASVAEVVAPNSALAADVIDDVSPSGYAGRTSNIPYPAGVHAVSIGSSGDLTVPGLTTKTKGAYNVVINESIGLHVHSDLPGLDRVDREVSLALADLPPSCTSTLDRLVAGERAFMVEDLERSVAVLVVGGAILTSVG